MKPSFGTQGGNHTFHIPSVMPDEEIPLFVGSRQGIKPRYGYALIGATTTLQPLMSDGPRRVSADTGWSAQGQKGST